MSAKLECEKEDTIEKDFEKVHDGDAYNFIFEVLGFCNYLPFGRVESYRAEN